MTFNRSSMATVLVMYLGFLGGAVGIVESQEIELVVPNQFESVEGNTDIPVEQHSFVFQNGVRGQEIIPASEFASLPDTHREITGMRYRPDGTVTAPRSHSFDKWRITLATTTKDPTALDLEFEKNLEGLDLTVVYDAPLTLTTAAAGSPRNFDYVIDFERTFTYDPTEENLFLELYQPGPADLIVADGHDVFGETAIFSFAGADEQFADNRLTGGVTQFVFIPEPASFILIVFGLGFIGICRTRRVRTANGARWKAVRLSA